VSGSDPVAADPAADHVFQNYRLAAIVTYVLSDIAIVGAILSWLYGDKILGVVLAIAAVFLTIIAIRSAQVAFIRSQIERFIDRGETVLAELGGRRHVRLSWFRHPLFLVLTDNYFYAFVVGFNPSEAETRLAYNNLMSVGLGTGSRTLTLIVELPDRQLQLVGITAPEVKRFEQVLNEKRPGLITTPIHPVIDAALD
jgi:hypothetical protein